MQLGLLRSGSAQVCVVLGLLVSFRSAVMLLWGGLRPPPPLHYWRRASWQAGAATFGSFSQAFSLLLFKHGEGTMS